MLKLITFVGFLLTASSIPLTATAQSCAMQTTGASCVVAGEPTTAKPQLRQRRAPKVDMLDAGTTLPRGVYNVIIMADYYGLPPVQDGWVYMDIDRQVYRVDFSSHTVIDNVTHQTAANW